MTRKRTVLGVAALAALILLCLPAFAGGGKEKAAEKPTLIFWQNEAGSGLADWYQAVVDDINANGGNDTANVSGGSGTITITRSGGDVAVSATGIGSGQYNSVVQVNVSGSGTDDTFVVSDANAPISLPFMKHLSPEKIHEAELVNLSTFFAMVCTTKELLGKIKNSSAADNY